MLPDLHLQAIVGDVAQVLVDGSAATVQALTGPLPMPGPARRDDGVAPGEHHNRDLLHEGDEIPGPADTATDAPWEHQSRLPPADSDDARNQSMGGEAMLVALTVLGLARPWWAVEDGDRSERRLRIRG